MASAKIYFTVIKAELSKATGGYFWKITIPNGQVFNTQVAKKQSGQISWNENFDFIAQGADIKGKVEFSLFEKKKSTPKGQFEVPIVHFIDKDEGEEWFEIKNKKDKTKGNVQLKFKYEFKEPEEIPPLPAEEITKEKKDKKKEKQQNQMEKSVTVAALPRTHSVGESDFEKNSALKSAKKKVDKSQRDGEANEEKKPEAKIPKRNNQYRKSVHVTKAEIDDLAHLVNSNNFKKGRFLSVKDIEKPIRTNRKSDNDEIEVETKQNKSARKKSTKSEEDHVEDVSEKKPRKKPPPDPIVEKTNRKTNRKSVKLRNSYMEENTEKNKKKKSNHSDDEDVSERISRKTNRELDVEKKPKKKNIHSDDEDVSERIPRKTNRELDVEKKPKKKSNHSDDEDVSERISRKTNRELDVEKKPKKKKPSESDEEISERKSKKTNIRTTEDEIKNKKKKSTHSEEDEEISERKSRKTNIRYTEDEKKNKKKSTHSEEDEEISERKSRKTNIRTDENKNKKKKAYSDEEESVEISERKSRKPEPKNTKKKKPSTDSEEESSYYEKKHQKKILPQDSENDDSSEKQMNRKPENRSKGNPFTDEDSEDISERKSRKTESSESQSASRKTLISSLPKSQPQEQTKPNEPAGNPFNSDDESSEGNPFGSDKKNNKSSSSDDGNPFNDFSSPPAALSKPKVVVSSAISIPEPVLTNANWFSPDSTVNEDLPYDVLYKVIILGDSGVGKTQFYNRWLYNQAQVTKTTINIGFGAKSYKINDQIIKVQLWDTAGQERYRAIARQYYRGAHGVILMYSIIDDSTFTNMSQWIEEIKEYTDKECRLLLIGNKNDLENQREVTQQEALSLSQSQSIAFLETSAQYGNNCVKAVQLIFQEIHEIQSKANVKIEKTPDNIHPDFGKSLKIKPPPAPDPAPPPFQLVDPSTIQKAEPPPKKCCS